MCDVVKDAVVHVETTPKTASEPNQYPSTQVGQFQLQFSNA